MTAHAATEHEVAAQVLTTMLRERYGTITEQVTDDGRGNATLTLADDTAVALRAGLPWNDLVVEPTTAVDLDAALDTVAMAAPDEDAPGVADFAAECAAELAARRLYLSRRDQIADLLGDDISPVAADARAAALGHPVHPTSRARVGLTDAQLVAYAPEFAGTFQLRWAYLRAVGQRTDTTPAPWWWPSPADVGLQAQDNRRLYPVHPLTVPALPESALLAPRPFLEVRPTLSMRTVQVDPTTALKLPIPVSTLGRRNRRTITPANLTDAAAAGRLLRGLLPDDVLVADEDDGDHAFHPMVARLIRRLPVDDAVTVAALPAPVGRSGSTGSAGTVADTLAARHAGGDRAALVRGYVHRLVAWQVDLLVGYGVALETHQQNLAVRFDHRGRPVFLVRDLDSLLVSPRLLSAAAADVPQFADPRILTDDIDDLIDLFVTVTLHLSAAAIAFSLLPIDDARALLRQAVIDALAPHRDHPVAARVRARTLDADRLVAKRMVTAATLVDKARSGARDVNKFYGTDMPNYLSTGTQR